MAGREAGIIGALSASEQLALYMKEQRVDFSLIRLQIFDRLIDIAMLFWQLWQQYG